MTRLAAFARLVALDHEAGTLASAERAAACLGYDARPDVDLLARVLIEQADREGVADLLTALDPGGTWQGSDDRARRAHAAGLVAGIRCLEALATVLMRRS